MVKSILRKVKPKYGFAHVFHLSLVAIVPPLVYVFASLDFLGVAIAVVLLSKWRIFAVKPHYWMAHVRTNSVDIIVGLSVVAFMFASQSSIASRLVWLGLFELWVLVIKPGTSTLMVSTQALLAQLAGVSAILVSFKTLDFAFYILLCSAVSYFCGRHFFGTFEEAHAIQYSWYWAFFSGCIIWILSHWLLFYGPVAQAALLLTVIGYGLAGVYFLHEHDKLTMLVRRQIIFVVSAVVFVMMAFSNWGDGIIK